MNDENPAIPPEPAPQRPQHMSARVPEDVSPGKFSTGVIVMTGPTEFVVDFIQNLGPPAQVAARVVMPHATMPQFIDALHKNLDIYSQRFGTPPELPRPPQPEKQPTPQEIYDELKLPEDLLSGAYANGVMIGHSVTEFKFDFLTNLFPQSAVSSRVFMAAPQVPRMLESLSRTFKQFQNRVQQQQDGKPAPGDVAPGSSGELPGGSGDRPSGGDLPGSSGDVPPTAPPTGDDQPPNN